MFIYSTDRFLGLFLGFVKKCASKHPCTFSAYVIKFSCDECLEVDLLCHLGYVSSTLINSSKLCFQIALINILGYQMQITMSLFISIFLIFSKIDHIFMFPGHFSFFFCIFSDQNLCPSFY